jgi:PKD domain
VEVVVPGRGTVAVPPSVLEMGAPDRVSESCIVRGTPGETPGPTQHAGVPVFRVLEHVEVESFGYLTIPRPNGTVAYLPAGYFEGESPFEGCRYALLSVESGLTKFFRPPLAGKPEDVNAEDNIVTVSGEALVVGVHQGRVVEVQVTPSTTSTSTGSLVQFTATVVGGGDFNFVWTFGDGSTAEGETVPHAFAGSGTYQVRVTATGTGGEESGGESGPVEVVVGNPPITAQPGPTTTPRPPVKKPTGAAGKGRDGRGGKGSKPAPSGGHKKNPKNDSSAQRSESPAGRSHSDDSAEPSAAPTSVAPEVPTTLPPSAPLPLPEEPSTTAPEGEAPAESAAPTARTPSPSPPPTTKGELVEGRLVGDDLGPTTLEEAVGGPSEGEGSRSAPGAVGEGGVGVPVGALIVVALLAGGALFEWRRSRPTS